MNITLQQLKQMSVEQRFNVFVGWLGQQAPQTPYDFMDTQNCALCQFGRFMRVSKEDFVSAGSNGFTVVPKNVFYDGKRIEVMPEIAEMFSSEIARTQVTALHKSKTLGELHAKLLPFVTPPMLPKVAELSEAALEAIELRPLIPVSANQQEKNNA